MGKLFGLIGYPLSHSFSKKYFTEKFISEGIEGHSYELFEIEHVEEIKNIIARHPELIGFNVTIPHKETIIPLLDHLDKSAEMVGAVNVVCLQNNILTGYNSDFYGFNTSLWRWLPADKKNLSAVILGTGGAAKAVKSVLKVNNIPYKLTSRTNSAETITYEALAASSLIKESKLIINTTPLGMAPNTDQYPAIPYEQISEHHFVFDLIYNPAETIFLRKAAARGAATKNGLEMLQLQAEKSWEIWTA
jgi:shikimate dehydrogenase